MKTSKNHFLLITAFLAAFLGLRSLEFQAAETASKQPADIPNSTATKGSNPPAASKGIATVVQTAPIGFFSDITSDGQTMLFAYTSELHLYEIGSGRLIKSIPCSLDFGDKVYFRGGEAKHLLVCKADGTIGQIETNFGISKPILEGVVGRVVGYDPQKDCVFVYNFERRSLSKVDVKDAKGVPLCIALKHSIEHVIVDSRGIINSIGMEREAGEEPESWIDSFSSSEDGFRTVHRGSKAVSRVVSLLGIPPASKLKIRRQQGWEGFNLWTDVEIGESVVWLDSSLNALPKAGWLLGGSAATPLSARKDGLHLLSLGSGMTHLFTVGMTLRASGISASETGGDLMWWRLNEDPLLSLANSNGKSRMPQDGIHYPSPSIIQLRQAKYASINLGKYIVWNAALDTAGSAACFVVTDPFAQKSIAYRKRSSTVDAAFDDQVLEFKSSCLLYSFSDKKINFGTASAQMNPLDNEYTEYRNWYMNFGQPCQHSKIAVKGHRYALGTPVWEFGSDTTILKRNPKDIPASLSYESGGQTLDSRTGVSVSWKGDLLDDNSRNEKYISSVVWTKKGRQIGSMKLEGTVHGVFPLDVERSLVWMDSSVMAIDSARNKILSSFDYEPSSKAAKASNRIAVCADVNTVFVLSDNGAILALKWDDDGQIQEQYRIYPQVKGNPLITTPEGFYANLSPLVPGVHFSDGQRTYPFEQFDLRLNRLDIILERLGAPGEAIAIARQFREKRLRLMGVTEDMLQPDFHLPEVEIVGPVPTSTEENDFALRIKAADSRYRLDRLRIFVNNVPVNGKEGESLRSQEVQNLDSTVSLKLAAGRNKVQVSVLNSAGAESLYANAEITCTAQRSKPTLWAISMGVSEYVDSDWNLRYAAKDAKDISARLRSSSGTSYAEVKELVLTDKEVNKESLSKIRAFLTGATIDDTVVMFVAGHGLLDDKYDYYFGTSDVEFSTPSKKGIAFDEFDNILAELPCLKKVLLIDTCHAGELDEDEKKALAAAQIGSAPAGAPLQLALHQVGSRGVFVKPIDGARGKSEWYDRLQRIFVDLRRGSGATILSSSAGAEYALESSEQKNGLFTYAVLEALGGKKEADLNKDGALQMSEMAEFLKVRVAELSKNKQTPNVRRVNLEGDFSLVKTSNIEQNKASVQFSKMEQGAPGQASLAPGPQAKTPEEIIKAYYRSAQDRDERGVASLLAPNVDYETAGRIQRSKVLADLKGDWKRYQDTEFEVSDFEQTGGNTYRFILTYQLLQGPRPRSGKLEMKCTLSNTAQPQISSIKSKVISAR
jgi:uncharacterized caspase-like protein